MTKILVVDDKKDNLISTTALLKILIPDCTVITASSGKEGIAKAKTESPDTILLDIKMPEMDGYEVCKRLKGDEETVHIPVIMVTAIETDLRSKVKGLEAGADAYLTKPFEDYLLGAQVRTALRIKRAEDKLRDEKDLLERRVKERTKELKKSEEKFSKAFRSSPVWVAINTMAEGRYIEVNETFSKVTGFGREETIGLTSIEIGLWPDPEERKKIVKIIQEKNGFRNYEVKLKTKAGNFLDVLCSAEPIEINGEACIISVMTDITERKQVEEALRESEENFKAVTENANDGIIVALGSGTHAYANRHASEITGYSIEELLKINMKDIAHSDEVPKLSERLRKRLAGEEVLRQYETAIVHKQGKVVPIEITTSRTHWNGQVANMVIIRDITERKQAEEEMREVQEQFRQSQKIEAIGQLAGGIAHDFNNLLTIISGNAQLSLLDLKQGDPLRENIEEIRRASERAADLTRQLLAFSRKQMMEMQVLDLNLVVQGLDKMLHRLLGEDIDLVTVLPEGIGRVKADPGQIEQVIINLAVNARDAMIEGGKLTIETANVELDEEYTHKHIAVEPGRYVMLSVSDTGVGMTREVKERIFEPFFTTKEMGKGTGLGLSTVYGIVKQSGANIWVYSEPDKGTTFKIYLPQVDEPLEELREEVIGEVPGGSETVLVVEDEETVRKFAVRLLKKQGYKVLEVPDGGKAFMLCEEFKEPIHLILTDVVIPGMSGRKVAERLKQIHPEMKVLYMSGYTDNVVLHHGILEKGVNFVQKPFTVDGLARKVREVLDKA